jgi:hypothetical protein
LRYPESARVSKIAEELEAAVARLREMSDDPRATDAEVASMALRWTNLDDDSQARFFVECARIMSGWEKPGAAGTQGYFIGRHLLNCECSTLEARELLRDIVSGMEPRS